MATVNATRPLARPFARLAVAQLGTLPGSALRLRTDAAAAGVVEAAGRTMATDAIVKAVNHLRAPVVCTSQEP
jgi:hypothetical protein